MPVSEFELSARAYNALKFNGIKYLSELIANDLEDLKTLERVSANIAEKLLFCAWEKLYLLRKSHEEEKDNDNIEIITLLLFRNE